MGRKAAGIPDWSQGLGAVRGPLGRSCTAAKDKGGSDLRLSRTFSHPRRLGSSQDIKSLCWGPSNHCALRMNGCPPCALFFLREPLPSPTLSSFIVLIFPLKWDCLPMLSPQAAQLGQQ